MWIMGRGKISKVLRPPKCDLIRSVELTLALEMISSMSLLAVVTFSPAHLSRLMLPRQNFWKLSPSPPQPPPSALSGAAVSWPLLRRFGHRIQRACLGQKPCLSGYMLMLRAIGKWNAMALAGRADLRRGLKNLAEGEGESPRLVVDCCELRRLPNDWESLPWI